eukprot:4831806-Pyramimonas_sp.AAC.1
MALPSSSPPCHHHRYFRIVPTVVGFAMMPRPPKSPNRTEGPAGEYPVVSATAAASIAPN